MKKCKICGKPIEDWQQGDICFSCKFWEGILNDDAESPAYSSCMIDGTHYVIGAENDKSAFRGFGGARFQIEFNDGTRIVTTNLWCQGEPSEFWKKYFPNNARFENNLKWTKIGECNYLIEKTKEEELPF